MRAPSTKVSIVMLITVLIVVLIIVFSNTNKPQNGSETENNLAVSIDFNKDPNTDTDSDGLLDWEENLWGTSPDNPDSDGDKTSDSEEIKLNRNPTRPAPDDENYSFENKILANIDSGTTEKTVTNKVINSLITNYFLLKQKGQLDAATKKNLVDSMFIEMVNEVDVKPAYGVNDLHTFDSDIDQEKLLTYAQQLASIQQNLSFGLDIASLPGGSQSGIPELLQETSRNIIAMEVPQRLIVDHLTLANNFYRYSVAVDIIVNDQANDPIKTLTAMLLFNEIGADIKQNHLNIYDFLKVNGIIYDNTLGTFKKVNNE